MSEYKRIADVWKSDADTYERLSRQVQDYDRFFDYNYAVIGASHAHHIKEHIPEHWGVVTVEAADPALDFYLMRKPKQNPKATLSNQLSLLWRREMALLQAENGLYKYPGKSKAFVKKYLLKSVAPDRLRSQMIEILYERDYSAFS